VREQKQQINFFEALLFASLESLALEILFKTIVAVACLKYLFWG
jgi:hypothetical protein